MEVWKDIKGYEGLYQVSSLGRVKALANPNRATHRKEHILSQCDCRGYKHVALCKNGKMHSCQVHRIVAMTFLEKPEGKDFVDHINTVKDDNRVENLRWCTEKENNNNPQTKKNRSESKRGIKNPHYGKPIIHKVKTSRVLQLNLEGLLIKEFASIKDAETETGTFAGNISRVCKGTRETAGGFRWKYAPRHVT